MQGLTDVMVDAARRDEPSTPSSRYIELFYARQNGYLTEEEMRRICYCDLYQQKLDGKLRTNRYIPQDKASSIEQAESWLRARNQNSADDEWLKELEHFKREHGISMSKKESQWYMYIHEGVIDDEIAACLQAYRERK